MPSHFFGEISELAEGAEADDCDTIMVACSDHGTAPDNVSFAKPGRLFILQRLAASIPGPHECVPGIDIEDICIGLERNSIRHIAVCGHLNCGVIRTWLRERIPSADAANFSGRFHDGTLRPLSEAAPALAGEELERSLIYEHVIIQLCNLAAHEPIRERLIDGTLRLHGWVADEASARIHAFDPMSNALCKK